MSVSVVIPVFNDTTALMALVHRLYRVSDQIGCRTELLLVDDGSGDETWENLKALKASHPGRNITLLRLVENSGQHNATLCGLAHAQGNFIFTMDADLQHPPEAIPRLLARLREHQLDLVYGTALAGHSWTRRLASRLFKMLTHRLGSPRIEGSAFRAMTAGLARHLIDNAQQPFTVIDSVLQENAAGMEVVAIEHHPREHGESSYTWGRLFLMALHVIVGAREFPRLLLLLAFCLAIPGTGLLVLSTCTTFFSEIDALRGLGLLLTGLFLLFIHLRVTRWNTLSRLRPRFMLGEKIE